MFSRSCRLCRAWNIPFWLIYGKRWLLGSLVESEQSITDTFETSELLVFCCCCHLELFLLGMNGRGAATPPISCLQTCVSRLNIKFQAKLTQELRADQCVCMQGSVQSKPSKCPCCCSCHVLAMPSWLQDAFSSPVACLHSE